VGYVWNYGDERQWLEGWHRRQWHAILEYDVITEHLSQRRYDSTREPDPEGHFNDPDVFFIDLQWKRDGDTSDYGPSVSEHRPMIAMTQSAMRITQRSDNETSPKIWQRNVMYCLWSQHPLQEFQMRRAS
jgi:hypothetical protein